MASTILVSTSPCKILTHFSKFKTFGTLSRFKTSVSQEAGHSKEKEEKFRCKDYIKLKQLDKKYKLTQPGFKVLDLGAAPGSWSQYLADKTNAIGGGGRLGMVIAMDINNFDNIEGVHTLPNMDFTKESSQTKILEILGRGQKFDCIFSDMLPAPTGVKSFDEKRMVKTIFYVYMFLVRYLKQGGSCVIKIQGIENHSVVKSKARKLFRNVALPETKAYSKSEVYLLGKDFLGVKT